MEKSEYIKNYLKEVPSEIPPFEGEERGTWLVSKDTEVYVGLKGLCDKKESIIDLLAKYEITKLDSLDDWESDKKYPVACIGFSEKFQTWYGWSHRAFYGFQIGSKVSIGDCAYRSPNKEDFEKRALEFWEDPDYLDMHIEYCDDPRYFKVVWAYSNRIQNEKLRRTQNDVIYKYPDVYGRGEWQAETLEDAKQMALDFADGVA